MPALRFVAHEDRPDLDPDLFAVGFQPGTIGGGWAGFAGVISMGAFEVRLLPVQARPAKSDVHLGDAGARNFLRTVNLHKGGLPGPIGEITAFKAQTADFMDCAGAVLDATGEPRVGLAVRHLGRALDDLIRVGALGPGKGSAHTGEFAFVTGAFHQAIWSRHTHMLQTDGRLLVMRPTRKDG